MKNKTENKIATRLRL